MTADLIWALVALAWALAAWDMVRRWVDARRAALADAKLVERVKKLETVVIALKTHAETTRTARPSPFARKAAG